MIDKIFLWIQKTKGKKVELRTKMASSFTGTITFLSYILSFSVLPFVLISLVTDYISVEQNVH